MRFPFFHERDIQAERNYATADDFRRLFTEDMASLYLLAFLLAGSHESAESCFVSGIEDCAENSSVFREWARSWARRVIIRNAVQMISPHPRFHEAMTHEPLSTAASSERGPDFVPVEDSGALTAKLVKSATLKIHPGFPHGMPVSHADAINQDLLAFIRTGK